MRVGLLLHCTTTHRQKYKRNTAECLTFLTGIIKSFLDYLCAIGNLYVSFVVFYPSFFLLVIFFAASVCIFREQKMASLNSAPSELKSLDRKSAQTDLKKVLGRSR